MSNVSSSNSQGVRVPKLRFPGFEGEYKTATLGEIANKVDRTDPSSNAPVMMISAASGFINQAEKYSRDNAGQSLKKYTLLKKGELAYNHGASKLRQFGCCFELKEDEARIPYVYHTFSIKESEFAPYIALLLNNPIMDRQLKRLVSSSVRMDGLLNISYDEYMSIKLSVPAIKAEQEKLYSFIEKLDQRIEKQRQLVKALKSYKRGVLSKLFPQKGETTPQYRFAGFTEPWERRTLGEIGKAQSGVGFPNAEQGGTIGIPFFKVSDMNLIGNEHEMYQAKNYVSEAQICANKWNPVTALPAIFFAKVGAAVMLNRKRLCRSPFLLDNNTMAYSLNENEWDVDFAKALFDTIDLTSLVQVGALPSYNTGDIECMKIYLPSVEEQRIIGEFFQNLDTLITVQQKDLDIIQTLKSGLLQQLFI